MASIVLDDTTNQMTTGGGSWSDVSMERFYGGSARWPLFASNPQGDTGQYGSLSITFQGTSIAFIGNTPNALSSQWAMVSVDGGPQYKSSYMDPAPPSARQWFQSPTLSDGTHTISISQIAGTSVDFVVITAGQNTPLSGKTLIVDDGDPSITYTGTWQLNTSPYTCHDNPHVSLPYGNATHQTNSVGATATFRFSGSNPAVYGVFTFNSFGSLSVTYTLDGSSTSKTYPVDGSTPEYINSAEQFDYYLLYQDNSISPGDHTLEISVTNSMNINLELDYITYSPSFNTLSSKPNLSSPPSASGGSPSSPSNQSPSSSSGQSQPLPSGQSSSLLGNQTLGNQPSAASTLQPSPSTINQTGSGFPSQYPNPTSTHAGSTPGNQMNNSTSGSMPIAAVVGGVMGGVIFFVLLVLLLLWRRRVSKRRALLQPAIRSDASFKDNPNRLSTIQPFVLTEPTTPYNSESTVGEKTSPRSALPQQSGDLPSEAVTTQATLPLVSVFETETETETPTNGISFLTMQQLQGLIQAFSAAVSPGSETPDSDGTADHTIGSQAEMSSPPAYEDRNRM